MSYEPLLPGDGTSFVPSPPARRWARSDGPDALVSREWLVTNGLGGYAAGTIGGLATRRFHGLLVAAQPAPSGRVMMVNHLFERLLAEDRVIEVGGIDAPDGMTLPAQESLEEFRLELGLPVWRIAEQGIVLEKRLFMPRGQNTTIVVYTLLAGPPGTCISLRPSFQVRPHEGRVDGAETPTYRLSAVGSHYEIDAGPPFKTLRLAMRGRHARCVLDGGSHRRFRYWIEKARGYDHEGTVWSPGELRMELSAGESCSFVVSTEPWETLDSLSTDDWLETERARRRALVAQAHPLARAGFGAELVLAADQFLITPATRRADEARAHAEGDVAATVIAGYPWFTDWGRDTMISLEGLALVTGRYAEARAILRLFAHYVREGLIPNMFPEGQSQGLYHTADASLWYFHAVDRYVTTTGDQATLRDLLPVLETMAGAHLRGTSFGIGVDPSDGLLRQGAPGYQLTWMDAKVDDWVVTPRRGKAVELNALFYNALRLLQGWLQGAPDRARPIGEAADRLRAAFNQRFWYEEGGYLLDVVDGEGGDDAALRPNQLLAIGLRHAVLDPSRWKAVVDRCERELVTPVGLRSLARSHPDYRPTYDGDLRSRDAAYHQGTVWGWLVGPFFDAYRRVYPDAGARVRALVESFVPHLGEACVGTISEIFDAEEPFLPRGCHAQAWSVAEVLRCLVALSSSPAAPSPEAPPSESNESP